MRVSPTPQETFDTVAKHLLTQRKKSHDGFNSCLYRGPRGLKCAIGVLIPDSEYRSDFENSGIDWLFKKGLWPEGRKRYKNQVELLCALQTIHDSLDISVWKGALKRFANLEHLEWKFETFNIGA